MKAKLPSQCRSRYSGRSEPADFPAVRVSPRLIGIVGTGQGCRDVLLYFRSRSRPSKLKCSRNVAYPRGRKPAESNPAGSSKHSISVFISIISTVLLLSSVLPYPAFAETNAPAPADLLWKEAQGALNSRKYREAQTLFDDFIKRNANDQRAASARVYVGICEYRQGGSTRRALDVWNRTVRMELLQKRSGPALLLALEQLAGHYRSESNVAELKKTLDQLLETFPDDPVTVRETSLFARECLDKGNWSEASDMFSRVEKKLSAQDKEGLKLARAMSSATGNAETLIRAADTRMTEDSSVLAARLYEEALKRDPPTNEKREAMTKLGWCLYLQRKHGDAEKIWREVMNSGPKGDEWRGKSRWHLVTLHAGSKNDVKTAIALCDDQAKEFAGGFLGQQAVFSKAWLLKITGEWKEAKAGFEQLLAEYPATADAPPVHQYIKECEEKLATGKQ